LRSDEELKRLAIDVHAGRIFTNLDVPDGMTLDLVFPGLIFLDDEQRQKLRDEKPYLLFEYMTKAGPMSINGFPTFTSFQWLRMEETEKLLDYVMKIDAAIKEI